MERTSEQIRHQLGKLLVFVKVNHRLGGRFPGEAEGVYGELDQVSQIVDTVVASIASGEITKIASDRLVGTLLNQFGPDRRAAMQPWCQAVLEDRFKVVPVAHHRPINALRPLTQVNPYERRVELAKEFGFRFESLARLLNEVGFWDHMGRSDLRSERPIIAHPRFASIVNALNGGARDIDYEGLFPEAAVIYSDLKHYRLHQEFPVMNERPSSLTVPDILFGAILERLNRGLPDDVRARAQKLSMLNMDSRVPNSERVSICQELNAIYLKHPVSSKQTGLVNALEQALEELSLPVDHPGQVAIEKLKEEWGGGVDVIVPLCHYDFGQAAWKCRWLLQYFPGALVCPSGLQQPHDTQVLGQAAARHTEAEGMTAALLIERYPGYFVDWPGMPSFVNYPAAMPWDIFIPGVEPDKGTAGNAEYVASRLSALYRILGRPARVLIVTTPMHSARAWAEFRTKIGEGLASHIGVWEVASPVMQNIGRRRDPDGILDILCEYVKRLYMVATM